MKEKYITEAQQLRDWLGPILLTVRLVGASPTRSGNQVQARIGYTEKEKNRVRCFTSYANNARSYIPGETIDFAIFLEKTFDVIGHARGITGVTWQDAPAVVTKAVAYLVASKLDKKTHALRLELATVLRNLATDGTASRKKNEAEILKAKAGISNWLDHGFKYGMDPEDMNTLVKEALVKSVLVT